MTLYEALFGTLERTAKSIEFLRPSSIDWCDCIGNNDIVTCADCPFEFDRFGCAQKDISVLDWLKSEVIRPQ